MKPIFKNKSVNVVGHKVIVSHQTEQELNMDELIQNKLAIQRRKQQLINQSHSIKNQYDQLCQQETEVDNMIILLKEQSTEIQPVVIEGEKNGNE